MAMALNLNFYCWKSIGWFYHKEAVQTADIDRCAEL